MPNKLCKFLAYKVRKAKELQQQNSMQLQAQQGQQNQQAAQITAQSQQQIFQQEAQLKIYLAKIAQETELKKKQMEVESQERIAGKPIMLNFQ